jgi:peptide/nickel transport system permease protein
MATTLPLPAVPVVRDKVRESPALPPTAFDSAERCPEPRPAIAGWLPWLGGRLLAGLATVLVISMIVFAATQALPSDPARVILGPEATQESVAVLQKQLGRDRPIPIQYAGWALRSATGDFGASLDSGVPAASIVSGRLSNSLALLLSVLAITIPLSFLVGVAMAVRRDRSADRGVMIGLILLKALPGFTIGIGLIVLFSTTVFPILPAVSLLDPSRSPFAQPLFLILPAATLILILLPFLTRLVRAAVIETLESEFVTAARLRGISERRVIWRHAVPNALVPTIQGIAMSIRMLLGGALIIEVVFNYPGIGNALNSAIEMRDIAVIQAITLIIAALVVVVNLIADLTTVLVTPKLRTASRPRLRAGTRARLKLKAGGI